jgi:hypothetical protein
MPTDTDIVQSIAVKAWEQTFAGPAHHASVKTTERAYAAFVKNERFKQTIDLLDMPVLPRLKIVK